jgi:ring-1,2-phenylacetyl-CoA epoxidase subunit PaaE
VIPTVKRYLTLYPPGFILVDVRSTLRALRRDIATLAASLTGRAPAPVVRTVARGLMASRPSRRLRVARVVRETEDAVTLVLEDPRGAPIPFAPGQFFTLAVPLGDELCKRAYSASSNALEGDRVAVTIKRTPDGRVSKHLVQNAREGDCFEVLGPSGSFTPEPASAPRRLVLVGGGSGITPLASIARTLLASEPLTRVDLVYGNRSIDDVIFKQALDALVSEPRVGARFAVRHVLERPPAGWTGGTGLLDGEALARELDALDRGHNPGALTTGYFLCGPDPMMRAARACLEARGVAPTRIREERFASAQADLSLSGDAQAVTVRLRTGPREIVVGPRRTVLEAAIDAGIDMPYSCTVGGCGTCRVRLLQGTVAMDEPNCLSEPERAERYVLACVARPTSPCVVEVP